MVEEVTLGFISRQITRLSDDVASVKSDIRLSGLRIERLETSLSTLVEEVRGLDRKLDRFEMRVRRVEDKVP